jgi:small subunit ribosomal protein S20
VANHKSAVKRNKQSLGRRTRNRANKTMVKTVIKAVDAAIDSAESTDKAKEALISAIPVIERAAVKGTLHKKNAARKVSRLTKRVNKFVQSKESAA